MRVKRVLVPVQRGGGPWLWRPTKKWSWWRLVPVPAQMWWVHRQNVRYCAIHGHDDTLWHMTTDGWIPPEPVCSSCGVVLTECAQNHGAKA